MPDSCKIYRTVSSDFGSDESVELFDTLACRMQQLSGREVERWGTINQSKARICFFIVDPAIIDGDWLEITSLDGSVHWVRVIGTEKEGSDRLVLWNAVGEETSAGLPTVGT